MKSNIELEKYINEVIESINELSVDQETVKEFIKKLYRLELNSEGLSVDFINELLKIYDKK